MVVPPAVLIELERGKEVGVDLPRVDALSWLIRRAPENSDSAQADAELGSGEKEVLAPGSEFPASILILDDRLAREHAAALGLAFTGTLGILVRAKHEGLVPKLEPVIDKLSALGFRLSSSAREAALQLADE